MIVAFEQRADDLVEVRLVKAGSVPGTGTYTYENPSRARLRGLAPTLGMGMGNATDVRWVQKSPLN